MAISLKNAESAVQDILKAKLVPNLLGSPGIGKSDLIRKIAKEFNLKVIDYRLAQSDPTDLNGFPTLNEDRSRSHYAPPITMPLEGDAIPTGYAGWLLFFDELTSAPNAVQAASYKVLLDRAVGEHNLHEKVAMVCAGNLDTDKAITNRLSTAMQSRLITLETFVEHKDWMDWASKNNIDFRIMAYLEWKPELLHKFNPNHAEFTFPCPRTWEFASKLLNIWGDVNASHLDVLSGTISKGAAAELITFCDIYKTLPTISQMQNTPDSVMLDPSKPDVLFAISSIISSRFESTHGSSFMSIIERMPIEFQVVTVQGILRKDRKLKDEPNFKIWFKANASELL